MKSAVALFLAGVCLLGPAAHAAGSVDLKFINPGSYTDAADMWEGNAANLQTIAEHLQRLGRKYLADGQSLQIEVLDIDLAGRVRPTRSVHSTRFVGNPLDWPRITLRYTLRSGDQVLQSGEESVADMGFQSHLSVYDGQYLGFEKRMLEQWFKQRFVTPSGH